MEAQNFTVAEAADYLNVSKTTMYELIKEDIGLEPVPIGAKTLIPKLALDDYLYFQYMDGGLVEVTPPNQEVHYE